MFPSSCRHAATEEIAVVRPDAAVQSKGRCDSRPIFGIAWDSEAGFRLEGVTHPCRDYSHMGDRGINPCADGLGGILRGQSQSTRHQLCPSEQLMFGLTPSPGGDEQHQISSANERAASDSQQLRHQCIRVNGKPQ